MSKEINRLYEFGRYRLDVDNRALFRDNQAVQVPPKAVELLSVLVERSGQVVSKDQLMNQLWLGVIVEDANLTQNIFLLRKVFAEDGQKYIETIPRRGYRFVAEVKPLAPPAQLTKLEAPRGAKIIEKHTLARIITETDDQPYAAASTRLPQAQPQGLLVDPNRRKFSPRWLGLVSLALILIIATSGYFFLRGKSTPAADPVSTKAIAVLPFKPINAEGQNEYLELGMADALITKLSHMSQVIVRPTSSVRKFAGAGQDALAAGRELGVGSVLEGSIQRLDDRIRVTVQLVSVRDGATLWAANFDEGFTDVFAIEDSISTQVARALRLQLTSEEQKRLLKRYTENSQAYELYLKGRYFWNKRTEQGFAIAIENFNQAIDKDPNYALAYAGLSDCYALMSVWGALSANEALPKARAAAVRATELDDELAEAHTSLAFAMWIYDRDWTGAETAFQQAIQANPRYPTAHHWYAYFLAARGRFDEAIAQIKQARLLDELSPSINTDVGEIYCWTRHYDEALAQLREVLKTEPNFAPARNILGMTYIKVGRFAEGVTELETARRLDDGARVLSALGCAYGISGQRDKAQRITAELKELANHRYISPFSRALVYAGLGEKDEAFAWLEKAYHEHSDSIVILKVYPWLDPLRSDPRFADLMRRVGLQP